MNHYFLLTTLLCISCSANSSNAFSDKIKQMGCQFGAERVSAYAVKIENSVAEIVSKTEPNSALRKKYYQELVDSTEKSIDTFFSVMKENKEEQMNDPSFKAKNHYQRISVEANLSIYNTAAVFAFELGIATALKNGSQNIKFSDTRYLRHIESECLSVR